jgi:urease accessory protein
VKHLRRTSAGLAPGWIKPSRRRGVKSSAPFSATSLLQLMWLASPALPIGGFSYSEGLEAAVEAGGVADEATACGWLVDQLELGLACNELAVIAQALDAWPRADLARVRRLNDWVLATRETSEQRLQTEQMGRSLAAWLQQRARQGGDSARLEAVAALLALPPAPTHPVAFALAASHTGATPRDALLAAGFGWAENMVQAALRAVPLGQSAGQRILAALADALPAAVDHALALRDDERLAALPALAILGARHETQYSRLFRS